MSLATALALIESVKDYTVLFVGDKIIDEYHHVTPLGKSAKEHIIPVRFESKEVFKGGVEAAANHLRTFCKTVAIESDGQVIRKVRAVDFNYFRKLHEVHYVEDTETFIFAGIPDVTAVTDFGHGAVTAEGVANLCASDQFLAVAPQTNSANIGFNLITKYPRADYVVIDEPEARLAAADLESPIEVVIESLAENRCDKFVVTRGKNGAIGYDGSFHYCKAMSDRVVDTMGAGDAFFAITAPMAKTGSMDDLLLIGNAAGALKTGIIGHRESVTKKALVEFLKRCG